MTELIYIKALTAVILKSRFKALTKSRTFEGGVLYRFGQLTKMTARSLLHVNDQGHFRKMFEDVRKYAVFEPISLKVRTFEGGERCRLEQ